MAQVRVRRQRATAMVSTSDEGLRAKLGVHAFRQFIEGVDGFVGQKDGLSEDAVFEAIERGVGFAFKGYRALGFCAIEAGGLALRG